MSADLFVIRAIVAVSAALLMCGAFAAWVSANALKRIAALAFALAGALLGAAALGAPSVLLIAGVVVGFAQLAVGAAVTVRVQEGYGAVEMPEINAADARDDAGPAP
jgi:multisubunit Na+/H+ antiporter MnhC subunit